MTTYKAHGKLVLIGAAQEFASGFKSRRFVVDNSENPNFKSPVEFQLKKDHVGDIEGYQPGEAVDVTFSIDGRQWDGPNGTKFFADLTVWKIERAAGSTAAPAQPTATATATAGGQSMQTAVETWKKYHGDDKAGFGAFCKNLKPGKKSSEYTSADWGEIVAKLEEEANAAAKGDDFDDIPF